MSENAVLLSILGNERNTIINWLLNHKVKFDLNRNTEELIELYRKIECGG